jgi:DNA (cytosine-5)-methyltransferase 1
VKLLDLFCCAGGAAEGYSQAGFEIIGVDIEPQRRYPFRSIQADALTLDPAFLAEFDAIHASPPCQAYSNAQRLRKNAHPDLIGPVREMLIAAGVPYVIENVLGAPLREPYTLCGGMFGLKTYRHREFETNFPIWTPDHPPHTQRQLKMGRKPQEGDFIQVVGNFSGVEYARKAMGIDWMVRDELREAIPPAYTQFIGRQLIELLQSQRLAA